MISFDDVTVGYGDRPVLRDVSLAVDRGTFLALVGPNGAGKTTLLRAANGLVDPDEGSVSVDGTALTGRSARETARLVATVPQETHLAFDFAVRDVVAMGRTPHRGRFEAYTAVDGEAVDRALERTRTRSLADRPVTDLSGGERQRVLLARALAQDTPALLLDEPTSSLDITHQVRTLELVRELVAEEGKTAVAAIHDLDLAARYCDRMALVGGGRLLADGPPEAVLTADYLADAFGARAAVTDNPVTGSPTVTALSAEPDRGLRVHVVGGGRAAARVLARLSAVGFRLSAGVLPEGDAALETARALGAETVVAPPFEAIDPVTAGRARDLARTASVTVVAGRVDATNREVARASDSLVALAGAADDLDCCERVADTAAVVGAVEGVVVTGVSAD